MPRTRRNQKSTASIDGDMSFGSAADIPITMQPTTAAPASVTLSQDQLSAMFEMFARTQAEANMQVIERVDRLIASSTPTHSEAPSTPTPPPIVNQAGTATPVTPMPTPMPPTPSAAATSTPIICSLPANFTGCTTRFSGSSRNADDLEAFIDAIEIYKECVGMRDDHALRGLPLLLEGQAAIWYVGVKSTVTSWMDALSKLRSAFGQRRPPYEIYKSLFADEQEEDERADVFVAKKRALIAKLPEGDLSEKVQLDMVFGLLHRNLRKRMQRQSCDSFEKLLEKARTVEESRGEETKKKNIPDASSRQPSTTTSPKSPNNSASAPTSNTPVVTRNQNDGNARAWQQQRDRNSRFSRYTSPAPVVRNSATSSSKEVAAESLPVHSRSVERSAHSPGRSVRFYALETATPQQSQCKHKDRMGINVGSEMSPTITGVPVSSTICENMPAPRAPKGRAYRRRAAAERRAAAAATQAALTAALPSSLTSAACALNDEVCPYDADASMFVSSRVSPTAGSCEYYDVRSQCKKCASDIRVNSRDTKFEYSTVSNPYCGKCMSDALDLSSMSVPCHTKDASRPILEIQVNGIDGTALIDTAAKRCIAGCSLYALLLKQKFPFVVSNMLIKLADGSMQDTTVKLAKVDVDVYKSRLTVPVTFVILPYATNNETLLGIDFITQAGLVLNFSAMTWHLPDTPQIVHQLKCEKARARCIECCSTEFLRDDEGTMLATDERVSLANLLMCYDDVFSEKGECTPYAEHHLDTGDHLPIAVPPYRLTPAKRAVMETEINKMLSDGVIEECESAWASPALLVPKKDGTFRFCVDYRKLNAITKTDSYPLPLIDDLLQYTKKNCYMSTIDLRSGYWQVKLAEQDRDKSAFTCPLGVYRFKVMPFGMCNAPATFQRLIDRFKSGAALKDLTLLCYLDDLILITEGSYSKHLAELQIVFDRLRVFKLRANRAKCMFVRTSVKYLGHIITRDGVSPDPDKVTAISNMRTPSSMKHLKSFLQTCSWFRKFVPGFSKIAQPLTQLTKKDVAWTWGEAQETAFNQLKVLLTTAPILSQPDYNVEFILRTDASNYALGAALLQGESPTDEHPIEYASRLLTPAERNYSTTEREALAVVWAVDKFRGYIDGHRVRVASDHQPLKWLLTLKSPAGRLVRWAMKLQAYDLHLEYTPGKANVIADTLSRPPCEDESRTACGICTVVVETPRWEAPTLREAQLADLDVGKIIKDIEGEEEVANTRWAERGYCMTQGVLYRYSHDEDNEEPQLVIPESLRKEIMVECHDKATAGHGGIDRTLKRIAQRYYFPGMRRFVTEYLKTCIECQRYKPSNVKPAGLLQTPVPAQRFEVLAVDLFGPLPRGSLGERWLLVVEDTASKWVELFPLVEATAEACARALIDEVFLRYGVPRRLISDNGVQFVADVMKHAMAALGVKQNLIPLYHPEANPVERKNRDIKTQLAILVEGHHKEWPEALPAIRFAMNTAVCKSTERTPAYLTFGRELRSPLDARADLRDVTDAVNYVPQITPYLRKLAGALADSKETMERQQDVRKAAKDDKRQEGETYAVGDLVLIKTHALSNASKGVSAKFMPKQDGPYVIVNQVSPTTYILAHQQKPDDVVGKYHVSQLKRYHARDDEQSEVCRPVAPKRKRGRPRKD